MVRGPPEQERAWAKVKGGGAPLRVLTQVRDSMLHSLMVMSEEHEAAPRGTGAGVEAGGQW